jgi:hypothetical protein
VNEESSEWYPHKCPPPPSRINTLYKRDPKKGTEGIHEAHTLVTISESQFPYVQESQVVEMKNLFLSLLSTSQGTPDLKIIVQNKVMSFMKEIACSSSRSFSKLLEKAEKS